jgi:hypothetical protein
MKLKTNKNFNKRVKLQFSREEREKKKKYTHRQQTISSLETHAASTRKEYGNASNYKAEGNF